MKRQRLEQVMKLVWKYPEHLTRRGSRMAQHWLMTASWQPLLTLAADLQAWRLESVTVSRTTSALVQAAQWRA